MMTTPQENLMKLDWKLKSYAAIGLGILLPILAIYLWISRKYAPYDDQYIAPLLILGIVIFLIGFWMKKGVR